MKKDKLKIILLKRGHSKAWTRTILAVTRERIKAALRASSKNRCDEYFCSGDYARAIALELSSCVLRGQK